MRIILLKDVGGVGKRDAVKDVADGYALNFLIPRGLAQEASTENLRESENRKQITESAQHEKDAKFSHLAKQLTSEKITIRVRVNKQGHLYEHITAQKIANEIKNKYNIDIAMDTIMLDKPILEAGEKNVEIRLGSNRARAIIEVRAI